VSQTNNFLFKSLNNEQLQAVKHVYGPLLVVAGAGSGKTKALTHRIANLIENNSIDPHNILAGTFTNKAAKDMKARLDGIANRFEKLSKRESESLLLEHLEWLEGGWETEEILFLKKPYRKWWF